MAEPEDGITTGEKIVGFILTLIAIPLLFVGTCVPVGFVALGTGLPIVLFGVYGVIFVGFGIYRAGRTDNPGIRWGIIVALIAATIYAAITFIPRH
jgi:hypothetical protein